jgi:short-subunit dehydrogenase
MTYVIIGATAGVGRALAGRFAAAGHDLVLVASDERDLRAMTADLAIRHGTRARWVPADVSADCSYLDPIAAAADELGRLAGLLLPVGNVADTDDCSFDPARVAWLTSVNLGSVVAIVTRFLPQLRAEPRATIVGFGSIAAARGRNRNVAYAAAKRGLQSFFESLRHACADSTVSVQFYVLGYMDTELARGIRTPVPKGDPEALSDLVLRNLGRDVGVVYYPWFWRIVSMLLRLTPWFIFRRLTS